MNIYFKGINLFFLEKNILRVLSKEKKNINNGIIYTGMVNITQKELLEYEKKAINNKLNLSKIKKEKNFIEYNINLDTNKEINIFSSFSFCLIENLNLKRLNINNYYSKIILKNIKQTKIYLNVTASNINVLNSIYSIYMIDSELYSKNSESHFLYAIDSYIFKDKKSKNTLEILINSIIKEMQNT